MLVLNTEIKASVTTAPRARHISQLVVTLLPVNVLKIVSGGKGGSSCVRCYHSLEKRNRRVDNFVKLLCSTLRPCG